ncbi:MAG: glycosyl hydrolase family 18 protein [Cellvibrio sp.]|uniref:glycosyl hydrolase family 18 protein n=1 Tax=Cellvibrio sp. TaxID=1965322 RepID=UPI00271EFB80|nr:glycosyl hydrolase family 18 protein [Cellvibrio sp.]
MKDIIKNSIIVIARRFAFASGIFLLCLCSINLWASSVAAETKVIGYIASFTDMKAAIDKTDLSKLTHINLSFTNPDAQGKLVNNGVMTCMPGMQGGNVSVAEVRYVIDKAHAAGVKVLASVAGGVIPACSGNWQTLLQPASRQMLVDNLIAFMEELGLDGIDVDIEGVLLTNIDNAGNYTPFIQALSAQLVARNKLLTCATASYVGGMIPVSSIPYFDFVNIMSYDAIGPSWGPAGAQHSPYSMAVDHVNLWKNRGLTKEQLVLGVPFYGYGFGTYKSDYTYASILSEFGAESANKDLIGNACAGCNYITYNGATTIKAKTKLGLEQGSGIMIWELSQDAAGANSLLKVIDDEINQLSSSSSSNQSSAAASSIVPVASSSAALSSVAPASSVPASSAKAAGGQTSGGGGAIGLWEMLLLSLFVLALQVGHLFRSEKQKNS